MAHRPLSHISISPHSFEWIDVLAISHTSSPSVVLGEEALGVAKEELSRKLVMCS
jgi:hypothetical protein